MERVTGASGAVTLVATRALTARSDLGRGVLVATELLTGGAALVSGAVLVIRPDGALLGLTTKLLDRTPFTDWRVPGTLLAGSVGIGLIASAALTLSEHRWSTPISVTAGAGLPGTPPRSDPVGTHRSISRPDPD